MQMYYVFDKPILSISFRPMGRLFHQFLCGILINCFGCHYYWYYPSDAAIIWFIVIPQRVHQPLIKYGNLGNLNQLSANQTLFGYLVATWCVVVAGKQEKA